MDNTFEIIAKSYGKTIKIKLDYSDVDIYELMDLFYELAIDLTYHHNTIRDGFIDKAEELKD